MTNNFGMSTDKKTTLDECRRLLEVAKLQFCEYIMKAMRDEQLDIIEQMTILHYLIAVILLKHLKHPNVVEDMTVTEWLLRRHHHFSVGDNTVNAAIVTVKNYNTSLQLATSFMLEEDEEMVFDIYFRKLRPTLLGNNFQDSIYFFISTTGEKIQNASDYLLGFHQRYDLTPVTSQEISHVVQNYVSPKFTCGGKRVVDYYLSHKDERFRNLDDLVMGSRIINKLGSEEDLLALTSRKRKRE
ncbi:uncharacterized protein LOC134958805 [Pseudophryne corroboree]|uniref:uncharacterized protein LOC134958805 n=1 Tax=Pseudophryne corroboree TaxID=495146 RepID=UPI0030815CFE